MRQLFLDTETTGLKPADGHRIVEIGVLEMIGNRFQCYINPERDIDPIAESVHGLSLDFLQGKPKFVEIADAFLDFVGNDELIIHNAPFDIGFLDHELKLIGKQSIRDICPSIVDTRIVARELFPGQSNSLDALCDRFDIDRSGRDLHGALIDCDLLCQVYLAMLAHSQTIPAPQA